MSQPLGVWRAEASARLFSSTSEFDDELHLVVETDVELETLRATPHLDRDGIDALNATNATAAFANVCGDAYVGSVTKGARFRALLTSHDRTVSKNVERALGAHGRYGAGSLEVSSAQELKSLLTDSTFDVEITQTHGSPPRVSMKPDEIIAAAASFACGVSDKNAGVVAFTVYPYSTVLTGSHACIEADNRSEHESLLADRVAETREKLALASFVANQLYPVWADACPARPQHEQYRASLSKVESDAEKQYHDCLNGDCGACERAPPTPPETKDMSCPLPGCARVDPKSGFCTRCEGRVSGVASGAKGFTTSDEVCRYMRPGADVSLSGDLSVRIQPGSDPHGRQCHTLRADKIVADVRGVVGGRFNVSPQTVAYSHASHVVFDHAEAVAVTGWGSVDPTGASPVSVDLSATDCQCMGCDQCASPADCTYCSATGTFVICSGDGCNPPAAAPSH
jgi:hypothetical protein